MIFSRVQDRLWKKLKGKKVKSLSRAGKEILKKYVGQAIPRHIVSCFRIPTSTCCTMESICAKFCWGQRGNERKVHWSS